MYISLTIFAYFIDRVFGEFKFIKHPVIFMGDYIKWYESKFYKNSIISGIYLTLSLILIVGVISYAISFLPFIILILIASTGIASNMLYHSVKDIIYNPSNIKYIYMDKIFRTNGNITKASYSLAPPAYSYHTISDFDVGKKGLGYDNFTAKFAKTKEFKKLKELTYISMRYKKNNKDGVRYEPWHVKVI